MRFYTNIDCFMKKIRHDYTKLKNWVIIIILKNYKAVMNRLLLKRSLTALTFVLALIVIEILLFVFLGWGIVPKHFFIDFAYIAIFATLIFMIPWHFLASVLASGIVLFSILISYTNIMLSENLNIVFSWDLMRRVSETQEVTTQIVVPLVPLVAFVVVFLIFMSGLLLISRIKVPSNKINKRFSRIILNTALSVFVASSLTLSTVQSKYMDRGLDSNLHILSDSYQQSTFQNPSLSLRRFGIFGYYIEDLFKNIFPRTSTVSNAVVEPSQSYNPKTDSVLWEIADDNNVIMIIAESFEWFAISPELTPTLYALANGYDLSDVGIRQFYDLEQDELGFTKLRRKDYSINTSGQGSFYNKNDINIFENLFSNQVGLKLENYFSKSFTDFAEAAAIGDLLNYNDFYAREYHHVLPSMLKDSGAVDTTSYLHTYAGDYYSRDTRMINYGFDNILFGNELPRIVDWERNLSRVVLDSKAVDYCLNFSDSGFDFITKNENFMSLIMTVTTHLAYEYSDKFDDNYRFLDSVDTLVDNDWTASSGRDVQTYLKSSDEAMNDQIRHYLAKAIDTEHMVALIVDNLIQKNIFDKTTLVFVADHNSHVNNISFNYKNMYYDNYSNLSAYVNHVPAFVYSTSITREVLVEAGYENGGKISKLTTVDDLTPTVLTMLGVQYDTNNYLGYPVLCNPGDSELGSGVYISSGYYTEKIYSLDGLIADFYVPGTTSGDIEKMSYDIVRHYNREKYINHLYSIKGLKSFGEYTSGLV